VNPIPLFGSGIKSFSQQVTAQRRLNCIYDIRPDGDKSNIIIRGTPGKSLYVTLPDNPIRGWWVVNFLLYIVAGSSVFTMDYGGNVTLLGTIQNSGQLVGMTDDSLTLTIVDGAQGWSVPLPGGAPVLITDSNFPNGCTSIATLDSSSLAPVPNSRNFNVSQKLAGATWTQLLQGAKENSSDILVAVDVLNGFIVLWGATHMECWQDVGNAQPSVPYSRINGASQTWGLAALHSRVQLSNTMVFLGQNPQGGVQILMLNGYTPQRISNTDIENRISKFAIYSDAIGLTYMLDGHPIYQLTFPNANWTFLYDATTGFWSEGQTGVGYAGRDGANLSVVFNAKNLVSDTTSGNIYLLDPNVNTDIGGVAIKRQVASRHIRMGGNEFSIAEIVLEMETGVGTDTGQGVNPVVMMQVSKDGGRTFGPERWKPLGQGGRYTKRVRWNRIGSARDFVFQFTMTDPVKFVIALGEAVLAPGTETVNND
jgi:hypothetical protein